MVVGDIRMVLVGHWEDREGTELMTTSICSGSFTKGQIFVEEGLDRAPLCSHMSQGNRLPSQLLKLRSSSVQCG